MNLLAVWRSARLPDTLAANTVRSTEEHVTWLCDVAEVAAVVVLLAGE